MNFNIKLNSKNKSAPDMEHVIKAMGVMWKKVHTLFFFVLLTVAILAGWFIWQKSLSGDIWSEAQKQEFLDSQSKGVVFKEESYNKAITDIRERKDGTLKKFEGIKDVFR